MSTSKNTKTMASNARSGVQVSNILNPIKPTRTKDYIKENLLKMRDLQLNNLVKKEIEERKADIDVFKLDKFKNVESVVFNNIDFTKPNTPPKTKVEKPLTSSRSTDYVSTKVKKLPSLPSREESGYIAPRVDKNFKNENAVAVINAPKRVITPPKTKRADYGKVPDYLKTRKLEMEADLEAKRIEEANKDIPPGMVKMSEEDRLKTLALLNENKEKVEDSIRRLPLRIETLSQKERQNQLLAKITEIDDAIKIFSRTPVYITP